MTDSVRHWAMKNETAKCFYYNLHSLSLSPISFSCFLDLPVALVSYFYYVLFFLNLCQANCAAFSALLAAAAAAADEFHYETNKSSHANATRRCCRRRLSDCTASCSFKSHFMHLLSMLNFVCMCVCVCVASQHYSSRTKAIWARLWEHWE